MSQQLIPIAVRDTVLDVDDKLHYAVFRSGQNISIQKYPANSQSASQHVYSIQVPSTSTVMSRALIWGSDITFTFQGTVQPYEYLVNLTPIYQTNDDDTVQGADCLAPFPLNQLCSNMTVQINNTNVSLPVNQVLDPLLRAIDRKEFQQYNGMAPTQLDEYGDLENALPERNINTPALAAAVFQEPFIAHFNSPFNNFQLSNCNHDDVPRGAFKIVSITGNTPAAAVAAVKTVSVTVRIREPIFVSPFLFGERDGAGLAGLTQINITCQMDATARRAWNYVLSNTAGSTKAITAVSYADSYIEAKYYTPKPSDLLPATIVTPLATYTNYQLPASTPLASAGASQLTSNSIQLNSYPDKVFVWVDDAYKYQSGVGYGNQLPAHYASIESVNITLNNQSGILSTFDATQLFKASLQSGSKQTWAHFSGVQSAGISGDVDGGRIPTVGSVLMLNFADVISIAQDYFAPGSLSTCQFQITVGFRNNQATTILPQLNTMMMYSGILSTSNGSSSAYTSGVLTKQNVLDASTRTDFSKEQLHRLVGGGFLDSLKSIAKTALPIAKTLLGSVNHPAAQTASKVLGAVGFGKRGGMMSGGMMSGGLESKLM